MLAVIGQEAEAGCRAATIGPSNARGAPESALPGRWDCVPSAKGSLTPQSVVAAARDQVSCDLAGEAAILNLKNGVYYGLDPVGARIWNLLQESRRVREIRDALLAEYEVSPERCERDLLALLEKLLGEGLIEVRDESAA